MHPALQKRILVALSGINDPNVLRQLLFEMTQVDFANTQEEMRLWGVVNAQHEEIEALRVEISFIKTQDRDPE